MEDDAPGDGDAPPKRVTLTELQNRALAAGIPSAKVRGALNDPDSPHERLLSLLLDQLHSQYVKVAERLSESDEWKVLSIVPPQPSSRRDLSLEPYLQQQLQRCTDSGDFKDFELATLQELAVSVGTERRLVADVVDSEPDGSRSSVEHVNAIKGELASMILSSQALLQQSVIETRALPSSWGGDREIGDDMMASYQLSAVQTADEEFKWLMEQQMLASSQADAETHRMRDQRHGELLDKIRAATAARDTVVTLQELSRQQKSLDVPSLQRFARTIGLRPTEQDSAEATDDTEQQRQAYDEDLEKRKILAAIRQEVPMPAARNSGSFSTIKLVDGLDLEERIMTASGTDHQNLHASEGANYAMDIDALERSHAAERELMRKYGSSHGPPRSVPVTPSVIEAYLSNHSHFACTRGFLPNISQQNGRGLRVHIFGRSILPDEGSAMDINTRGAYMHLDASGIFFGKRNLSPDWEIIERSFTVDEYLRDRVSELIQVAVGADTEEKQAQLEKELRVLSLHELRQRARRCGVAEHSLEGSSPSGFIDKGWRSVDVFIKSITTGTYLRGDPHDAQQKYDAKREKTSAYGAVGADHSKREIFRDRKRRYLTVELKQEPQMGDQNMWRCEWKVPQLEIMEWIEKLEILGQHGPNQDLVRYHFHKMLETEVLGVRAVDELREGLGEEDGGDSRRFVVLGYNWATLSEWADLLSQPAREVYCDAMQRISMEIEPDDFSSDLVNGSYGVLSSGSQVMLASIKTEPPSDDDIEKDRIVQLLVEGNHYTSLFAEMRQQRSSADQATGGGVADTTDDMSQWSVEKVAEWIARIIGVEKKDQHQLQSRVEVALEQGKTVDSMGYTDMRKIVDGLVSRSMQPDISDTRKAIQMLIRHRHTKLAKQDKQRMDVQRWLEGEDLASLRDRARKRDINESLWAHDDALDKDGPLRAWLTRRGVTHMDPPSTSDDVNSGVTRRRYEQYLRRLVARSSEKLSYLFSHSSVENEVISWSPYRQTDALQLTDLDMSWKFSWDDNCVLDGPAVSVAGVVEIQQHEWAENNPVNHDVTDGTEATLDAGQSQLTGNAGVKTVQEIRRREGDKEYGSPSRFNVQLSAHGESRSEVCTLSRAGDVISICIVPTSFDLLHDLHERKYEWLVQRWQEAIDANYQSKAVDPTLPRTLRGSALLQEVLQRQKEREVYNRRPMRNELYNDLITQIAKVEIKRLAKEPGDIDELEKIWRERYRREVMIGLSSVEKRWSDLTFGPRGWESVATSISVDTFPQVEFTDWWAHSSAVKTPDTAKESVTIRSEWAAGTGLAKMIAGAGISADVPLEKKWSIVLREVILRSQRSYEELERKREAVRENPELGKETMKYIGPHTELNEIRPQLSHLETHYEMRACFKCGLRQDMDLRRMPFRRIDFVADVFHSTLMIADTGLGLTQREVETVLGRFQRRGDGKDGSSDDTRYLNFERDMQVQSNFISDPHAALIGHLSMGFWALFGVAEKVTLVTVDWETKEQMYWTLPKPPSNEEEALRMKSLVMTGAKTRDLPIDYPQRDLITKDLGRGTKIILNLLDTERDVFADGLVRLESYLQDQSSFARFPLCLWEANKAPPFVEVHMADPSCACRLCLEHQLVDAESKMSLAQMWDLIEEHNARQRNTGKENDKRGRSICDWCKPSTKQSGWRMGLRDLDRNCSRTQLVSALDRRGFKFEENGRYSFGKRYKLVKKFRARRKVELVAGGKRTGNTGPRAVGQVAIDVLVLLLWSLPIVIFMTVAFGDLRDIQDLEKFSTASIQILWGVMTCRLESHSVKAALMSLSILWGVGIWGMKRSRRNIPNTVRHGSRSLPGQRRAVARLNRPVVVHTVVRSSVPFKELELTWYRLTEQHSSYFGFLQTFLGRNMQHAFPPTDRDFPRPADGQTLRNRIFTACFPLATSVSYHKFMAICTTLETAGLVSRAMGVNLFGLDLDSLYQPGGFLWYTHLIFVVDTLVKIGGLGASYYFWGAEKWNNRLDFALAYVWYIDSVAWLFFGIPDGSMQSTALLRVLRVCQEVRNSVIAQASIETHEQTEVRQHMKDVFLGEDHVYQNRRQQLNRLLQIFPHPQFAQLFRNARGEATNPACCGYKRDSRDWGIGIKWGSWFVMELEAFAAHCSHYMLPNVFSCTYLRRKPKNLAWYDGWPVEIIRRPLTLLSRHEKYFVRLFGRRMKPILEHMEAKTSFDDAAERKKREWAMESAINAVRMSPQSDDKLARLHKTAMLQPEQGVPVQEWGLRTQGARANGIVLDYETVKVYVDGSREMYEGMEEGNLRSLCKNNHIATTMKVEGRWKKTEKFRNLTKSELVAELVKKSEEINQAIRPAASRAQFCVAHKRDEDRRLHLLQCPLCDQDSLPSYGDPRDGIARFCANHKNQHHVDVRKKCCEVENCSAKAEYGHMCVHPCPFSMANACGGQRRWYYETKVTAQIIGHVGQDWKAGHFRCEAKLKSDPRIWDATDPLRLDKEQAWMPYATCWTGSLVVGIGFVVFLWTSLWSSFSAQCGPQTCDVYRCDSSFDMLSETNFTSSSMAIAQTVSNGTRADPSSVNQSETTGSSVTQLTPQSDAGSVPIDDSVSGDLDSSSWDYNCSRPNPRNAAAKFVPLSYEALDPWRCESQFSTSAFDFSDAKEELSIQNFTVKGVLCSSGYVGIPVVAACTDDAEAYSIVGCVAERCSTWRSVWLFIVGMYLLRVAVLTLLHLRSRSDTAGRVFRHAHIGWTYQEIFSNSLRSAALAVQQISGGSSAFAFVAQRGLIERLWPHMRMAVSYLQLLAMLPIILQWDHSYYFPFVASMQSLSAQLLDPFATVECLLPEYGSAPRVMFPICFVAFVMTWMLWDGFTLEHQRFAIRMSVERLLGLSSPQTSPLSPSEIEAMFQAFLRLHRTFPRVQASSNKFWISRTDCARGQIVVVLDTAAWDAVQDSNGPNSRRPGETLLKQALDDIRDSFFDENARAMRGDTKRSHTWGKHLGLRTVFDVNNSFDSTPPSYLVTFHQLLPALRQRVWSYNELVARRDDFLFSNRAERVARVVRFEEENSSRMRHGLLRNDYCIMIGAWALPKIHEIATAMVLNHKSKRRDRVTRRMSIFDLEKLDKGSGTSVVDTSRLCLEVHVYQAEATKTREVVYKTILRLIIEMMEPETGLQARPRGQVDEDFERWLVSLQKRQREDEHWQLRTSALMHFLQIHKRKLLRVPTGAAHAACKTFRLSHWQIVAAWQALFVDNLSDGAVSYKSIFASLDAAGVEILDTEQGYHMLNEDYDRSLRLDTRAKSKRMELRKGKNYHGNLVAGKTNYEIFRELHADWETQEAKRAAIQADADAMKQYELERRRKLKPYKPHGFRVFAVLSDAFGRIKAFQSIQEDPSTFPEDLVEDVTRPPPVQYRLKGLYYFSKHILTPLHRHAELDVEQQALQKRLDEFRLRCWREAQAVAYHRCTEMAYFMFTPLATLAGRILVDDHHWLPVQAGQTDGVAQSMLMQAAGLALVAAICLIIFSILPAQIKHDVPHQIWGYLVAVLLSVHIGVAMSDDHEPLHEFFDMYTSTSLRHIPLFYALGIPFVIAAQLFHFRQELKYDESEIDFFEWQTAVRNLRKKGELDLNQPPEPDLDKFLKRGFRNLLNTRVSRYRSLTLPRTITQQQVDAVCSSRESWSSWFDTINDVEPVSSLDLSWLWWRMSIPPIVTALWGLLSRLLRDSGLVSLEGGAVRTWSIKWWVHTGVDWAPTACVVVIVAVIWIAIELRGATELPDAETHAFVSRNRFIQAQLSGVTGTYKLDKFWYEALEYIRKLTMTVGLCSFNPGSTEQLFAATVASCAFLCCAVWIEPHAADSLNRTRIACEMVVLLVILSAIAARVNLSASMAQSDECLVASSRGEFSLQDWSLYLEWALSYGVLWMMFAFVLLMESQQLKYLMHQTILFILRLVHLLGLGSVQTLEDVVEGAEEDDEDDSNEAEESEEDEEAGDLVGSESNTQDDHGRSTPNQIVSVEEMAIKIQRWWRGARARRTLQDLTRQPPARGVNRGVLTKTILAGWAASLLLAAMLWVAATLSQPADEPSCKCAENDDQPLTAWPTTAVAYLLATLWFLGGLVATSFSYYQQGTWLPHLKFQEASKQTRRTSRTANKEPQTGTTGQKERDFQDIIPESEVLNPLAEEPPDLEFEPQPEPQPEPEPEETVRT